MLIKKQRDDMFNDDMFNQFHVTCKRARKLNSQVKVRRKLSHQRDATRKNSTATPIPIAPVSVLPDEQLNRWHLAVDDAIITPVILS